MSPSPQLQTLEDVIRWAIEHGTREEVLWENQGDWNERTTTKLASVDRRLTALEKRVIWFTGAAAGVGAMIGTLLQGALSIGG